jgi:hypothetical protein
MNKYQQGKIYKIVSPMIEICYVGSTYKTLKYRLTKHKGNYADYLRTGSSEYMTSFELIGRYDDIIIILIENYPCETKEELLKRENYWINLIPCFNRNNAIDFRINKRKYAIRNREHIKEYQKNWYQKHKEEINKNSVICDICGVVIAQKSNLSRHKKLMHGR